MRVLCIDHFFEQDIEAMRLSEGESHHCWSVSFERFLRPATEIFDERVSGTLDGYHKPEFAEERARYEAIVDRELARLYRTYRFDAVLAPSDTFFWIRAVTRRCQALGIPMVVLQKEATLPPGWLERPAVEWGQACPFIADHMLVSSEHHRQFWLNAGVEPERVTVTGQPRFDVYARPEQARGWPELGVDLPPKPTVLFLTYDSSAYLPMIDRSGHHPWLELREQTEQVLLDVAASGDATVLIKGHPQPSEDQSTHLAELALNPGVKLLDPQGDVRHFLRNADVVVGFQTTALLEAMGAGVPAIYTWWTEPTKTYEADLIPFHLEDEALDVVRSPEELRAAIEARLASDDGAPRPAAQAMVERFLGPIDGHAADRCWAATEAIVASTPAASIDWQPRRAARWRAPTAAAALAGTAVWSAALATAPAAYGSYRLAKRALRTPPSLGRPAFEAELARRRDAARERLDAALAA